MDLISSLAQNGLLALLLAISITGGILIFKMYVDAQEKRLQESKEMQANYYKAIDAFNTTTTATLKALSSKEDK